MKTPLLRAWTCAAALTLATTCLQAQSSGQSSLKPEHDPGERYVDYVGHFGEVLRLSSDWPIQPSTHGDVEVINQFSGGCDTKDSVVAFTPKPEDYVPENFSRCGLIQLLVMPPSSLSLGDLKREKILDLQASHLGFKVGDDPWTCYGCEAKHWAPGSFAVEISTPYRLTQLYTATHDHLFILTGGVDAPPSSVIMGPYNYMRTALGDWILPKAKVSPLYPETPREIIARGIVWREIASNFFLSWATLTGLACLLTGILILAEKWGAARRAGAFFLLFSHAGALVGGVVGLCCWPFIWFARRFPVVLMITCLFMPALAFCIGRLKKTRARPRAMLALNVWTFVAFVFCGYIALASNWGGDFAPVVPSYAVVAGFVFFGIGGIIFGLLDSPPATPAAGKALLMLTLVLLAVPRLRAQSNAVVIGKGTPNVMDAGPDLEARARLEAQGKTKAYYTDQSRRILGKTQTLYDYQRVEIKGIWSKEDTNAAIPNLFDKQIEPSHIGDQDSSDVFSTPAIVQGAMNRGKDLIELHRDAAQDMSDSAKRAVRELNGKEVNEIVAHSWGAEIVYNAILNGDISAPRRLIVAGMPDQDLAKWQALSKYTGTEVVVYTDSRDPVAGAARFGGSLGDSMAAAELSPLGQGPIDGKDVLRDMNGDSAAFERQWAAACGKPGRQCNPHQRHASDPVYKSDYQGPSHARLGYYHAMLNDGTIPAEEENAYALAAKQQAQIDALQDNLFSADLEDARDRIELERGEGDADLPSAFKSAQSMTADSKKALAQDLHEADRQKELAAAAERNRVAHENDDIDAILAQKKARETAAYNYMKTAAGLACSSPEEFRKQINQGRVVGVTADIDVWALRLQMDDEQGQVGWDSLRVHMSACQESLMQQLMAANGPVPPNTLIGWASTYRESHPNLIKRFGTSLADFSKALGDFLGSVGDSLPDSDDSAPTGGAGNARRNAPPWPDSACSAQPGQLELAQRAPRHGRTMTSGEIIKSLALKKLIL